MSDSNIEPNLSHLLVSDKYLQIRQKYCSEANNKSDPSSEYSPLGLTCVMNHYFGQKFTTWVNTGINCLDKSLQPGNGIPTSHFAVMTYFAGIATNRWLSCIQNG